MQKSVGGHFELAVWINVTSINMSCFFTIIKTVSISCNWTDQLLFTYNMALCTSHSHSFVCGWSIVIKFTYLTDIYIYIAINWWKIQQNMPGRFLEIPVFLGDYFIMPLSSLSVTHWYCVETAQRIVKLSSLPGSPMILVFWGPNFSRNSNGNTPMGALNARG